LAAMEVHDVFPLNAGDDPTEVICRFRSK